MNTSEAAHRLRLTHRHVTMLIRKGLLHGYRGKRGIGYPYVLHIRNVMMHAWEKQAWHEIQDARILDGKDKAFKGYEYVRELRIITRQYAVLRMRLREGLTLTDL